jgi:hypothetical protein
MSRATTATALDPTALTAVTADGWESPFADASERAIARNLATTDAGTREPVT